MLGDNKAALSLVDNPIISPKTKHINVAFHYSREQVEEKELRFEYVPTSEMVADIFTKALPEPAFSKFQRLLGIQV